MCVFYKKDPKLGGNANVKVDANTKLKGSTGLDPLHAHGMAWPANATLLDNSLKDDIMKYISDADHYQKRGYYGHLPLFSKCNCVEKMPTVTRSDCTMIDPGYDAINKKGNMFTACQGEGG